MTSGFFPGGYDDLFGRYAGGGPRQPRRIDITQLLTERARDLVNAAARRAAETGSPDLRAQDIQVEFTEEAVDWLAERGFEPEFGARPLRRVIQREVDNPMSRLLLDGRVHRGQQVRVVVRDGGLDFEVVESREPATAGQS